MVWQGDKSLMSHQGLRSYESLTPLTGPESGMDKELERDLFLKNARNNRRPSASYG